MTSPLNIVVLLGGPSAEREVSLRSGCCGVRSLKSLGHHVNCVDPVPGHLSIPGTDVAFPGASRHLQGGRNRSGGGGPRHSLPDAVSGVWWRSTRC